MKTDRHQDKPGGGSLGNSQEPIDGQILAGSCYPSLTSEASRKEGSVGYQHDFSLRLNIFKEQIARRLIQKLMFGRKEHQIFLLSIFRAMEP